MLLICPANDNLQSTKTPKSTNEVTGLRGQPTHFPSQVRRASRTVRCKLPSESAILADPVVIKYHYVILTEVNVLKLDRWNHTFAESLSPSYSTESIAIAAHLPATRVNIEVVLTKWVTHNILNAHDILILKWTEFNTINSFHAYSTRS